MRIYSQLFGIVLAKQFILKTADNLITNEMTSPRDKECKLEQHFKH